MVLKPKETGSFSKKVQNHRTSVFRDCFYQEVSHTDADLPVLPTVHRCFYIYRLCQVFSCHGDSGETKSCPHFVQVVVCKARVP